MQQTRLVARPKCGLLCNTPVVTLNMLLIHVQVIEMIKRGLVINVTGLGATLIGIQTLVGMLVAKTLTNASVNPFMASAAGSYNPVLALDVFLVQAATNTLFGHFLSLLFSLWLLNVMIDGRGRRFQVADGGVSGGDGAVVYPPVPERY